MISFNSKPRITVHRSDVPEYVFRMLQEELHIHPFDARYPCVVFYEDTRLAKKFALWMRWHKNPKSFQERLDEFEFEAWETLMAKTANLRMRSEYYTRARQLAIRCGLEMEFIGRLKWLGV